MQACCERPMTRPQDVVQFDSQSKLRSKGPKLQASQPAGGVLAQRAAKADTPAAANEELLGLRSKVSPRAHATFSPCLAPAAPASSGCGRVHLS